MSTTLLLLLLCQVGDPSLSRASFVLERGGLQLSPQTQTILATDSGSEDTTPVSFELSYDAPFSADMRIRAALIGPGLDAPYNVDIPATNGRIDLPRTLFNNEGVFRLTNVRLERNGQLEAFAEPRTAEIQVADQFLVSEVKVSPLTKEDLLDRGYIFSDDDYYTVEFELALMMGSKEEKVQVPVAFPKKGYEGFKPPVIIQDPFKPYVRLLPMPRAFPGGVKLLGGVDGPENGGRSDHYIPGLIAIPGNFQYLKSHFEVTCLVLNTAPDGFDVVAERLKAELVLPPANSGPLPLRVTQSVKQDVVNLGEDNTLGTADDRNTIHPGEEGQVSYVVIGEVPGMHDVTIKIEGDLHLGQGTTPVNLVTEGQIFVRSPEFTVDFEHPDAVRQGDAYDLIMRLNNKGEVPLEDFTVNLDQELIVGAELLGSPTQNYGSIAPGESATITYRLRALVSGRAIASYVSTDIPNTTATSLTLRVGVGNLGERYSPYVISYPQVFYQEFPNAVTSEIRNLAKTALDFSQMRAEDLPNTQPEISATAVRNFNEQVAFIARSGSLGQSDRQQLVRLLVMWMRGVRDYLPLDTVRRNLLTTPDPDAPGQMLSDAETAFGIAVRNAFGSGNDLALLQMIAQENEDAENLFAAIIDANDAIELDLHHNGQTLGTNGAHDLPFATLLPLSNDRYLVLASALEATPQLNIRPADAQTTPQIMLASLFPARDGRFLAQAGSLQVEELLTATFDPATAQLQVQPASGPAQAFPGTRIVPKPFELLQVMHADPTILGSTDAYGRDVIFSFSKSLDLRSLEPLEEHVFINGKPVVDAVLQTDNRTLIVSTQMALGPYRDIRYELRGARSRDGQNLPQLSGSFEGSSYYIGVTIAGRVVDRNGADLSQVEVLHFKRDPAHELQWNVLERTELNDDGSFTFDFSPFPPFPNSEGEYAFPQELKIGVLMPDGRYQEREFMPLGAGQELIAEFAFLQQGTVEGRVLASAGDTATAAPVSLAQVYVVNQNDPQTARLVETDENGFYRAEGIEVGPVLVKSANDSIVGYASGHLTQANSPLRIDVIIDRPIAHISGNIAVDDNGDFKRLEGALVAFLLQNGIAAQVQIGPREFLDYTVLTQTDETGAFQLEDVPAGNGFWWVYYPGLGYHERLKVVNAGDTLEESHTYELRLPETGSVSGIVENAQGVRLQDANVNLAGQRVRTRSDGSYTFYDVELNKLHTLSASYEGLRSKATSLFLEESDTQAPLLVLRENIVVSGTLVDANDQPIPHAFIYSPPNWAYEEALTQTNAAGEWTAELPEPGTYVFTALEWPNILATSPINVPEGGMSGIRIKARQNADLRVEVVDEAGEPMDAKVFAMSELPSSNADILGLPEYKTSHNSIFTSTLDGDGRGVAYLRGVNAGPFEVYARDPFRGDSETLHGTFDPQSSDDDLTVTLVIPNTLPPANLFGRVLSPDGVTPAPEGTFVQVQGSEINASSYINEQGSYRFETLVETINPVRLTVIAYNPDQNWFTHSIINLSNDLNFRNDMVLNGQGSVSVTVVDENSVPVNVAAVTTTFQSVAFTPPVPPEEFGNLKLVTQATEDPLQITPNNPVITFENIPAGPFTLQVDSQGLAGMRTFTMPLQGADLNVEVPVEAASSISGEFVDRLDGLIGGAEVQLYSINNLLSQKVTSEAAESLGHFSFNGLPMRTYRLNGTDPRDGLKANLSVTTSPYQPNPFVTLRIDPTADLSGIVYNDGQPVPNARVKLTSRNLEIITGTNAQGRYQFVNLPLGNYSVVADTAAFAGKIRTSVALEQEGLTQLDLYYSISLDVDLTVLSSTGQPIPNMQVTAMNEDYREVVGNSAFTDATGIAKLTDLPPGRYRVVGSHPEEPLELWDHFTITEADPEPIFRDVQFRGHGGVAGRVLQTTGDPLETPAIVTIEYEFGSWYTYTIITQDDGSYRLGRIPEGVNVRVTAFNETTRETATERVTTVASQDTQVDLTFEAATFVRGIVRFEDGSPAAFAEVRVSEPFNMDTRADASGEFTLSPILEGDTTIRAQEENGPRQGDTVVTVSVVDGAPEPVFNAEIVLGGVADLSGMVSYFGGNDPVRAGTVTLQHEVTGASYSTIIQGDGAYVLPQVPVGDYHLTARDPKYDRRTEPVSVSLLQDQQTYQQDITYPESYTLSGTVTLANGVDPAVLATVELYYPDSRNPDNWRLVYLDEANNDGYFEIDHVYASKSPEDVYLLVIEDAGLTMRLEQSFYMPAQATSRSYQLIASSWVTGNLADANGNPFSEGSVSATQATRTLSVPLDRNGGFRIDQLSNNAFTTVSYSVANGWLRGSDTLITRPGDNYFPLRTDPTATLSGRAILVEGGATHPSVTFRNSEGIARGVRLAADGSFDLQHAPVGETLTMTLKHGFAVKHVDFTVGTGSGGVFDLGTYYLDPIAPNVSFADDGGAINGLPYTMTFQLDEPHPGSQVAPDLSRVWVNGEEISSFFDRAINQLSAIFTELPDGFVLGHNTLEVEVGNDSNAKRRQTFTIDLNQSTVRVEVQLVQNQTPVNGLIKLNDGDFATTDPNGRLIFEALEPGAYTFKGRGEGLGVRQRVAVGNALVQQVVLNLGNVGTYQGFVVDENAQPVANAAIYIGDEVETTNAEGRYTFDLLPLGTYNMVAEAGNRIGFASPERLSFNGHSVDVADIVLAETGVVEGFVFDADGSTPIANGLIELAIPGLPDSFQRQTTADSNGQYRIEGIIANRPFSVVAEEPDSQRSGVAQGEIAVPGETLQLNIQLQPVGDIEGFLLTVNDLPAFEQIVTISGNGENRQVTTGLDGSFRFENLRYGTYSLASEDRDARQYLAATSVSVDQEQIELGALNYLLDEAPEFLVLEVPNPYDLGARPPISVDVSDDRELDRLVITYSGAFEGQTSRNFSRQATWQGTLNAAIPGDAAVGDVNWQATLTDHRGQSQVQSGTITLSFVGSAPQVVIDEPVAGASINEGEQLYLNAQVSDLFGIDTVEVFLDGVSQHIFTRAPYRTYLDLPSVSERTAVQLEIVATNVRNQTARAEVQIFINPAVTEGAPTISLVAPQFNLPLPFAYDQLQVKAAADIVDPDGFENAWLYINDLLVSEVDLTSLSDCQNGSCRLEVAGTIPGNLQTEDTLEVRLEVSDQGGNTSAAYSQITNLAMDGQSLVRDASSPVALGPGDLRLDGVELTDLTLILAGGEHVIDGDHPLANLVLINDAQLTQTEPDTNNPSLIGPLRLNIAGAAIIDYGAAINLDGKGYRTKPLNYAFDGPASHAGLGAAANTNEEDLRLIYGSPFRPQMHGSHRGGGALQLTANDLWLVGDVSANGLTIGSNNGSGGSLWITFENLQGYGQISANGYNTSTYSSSGSAGGGGGRIALYGQVPSQVQVSTFGGRNAGAGTLYIRRPDTGTARGYSDSLVMANHPDSIDRNNGFTAIRTLRDLTVGPEQLLIETRTVTNVTRQYAEFRDGTLLEEDSYLGMTLYKAGEQPGLAEIAIQTANDLRSAAEESFGTFMDGDLVNVGYRVDEMIIRDGANFHFMDDFGLQPVTVANAAVTNGDSPLPLDPEAISFANGAQLNGHFVLNGDLTVTETLVLDGQLDIPNNTLTIAEGAQLRTPTTPQRGEVILNGAQLVVAGEIFANSGPVTDDGHQASHGGIGTNRATSETTYGSLYAPVHPGRRGTATNTPGGFVSLTFDEVTIDGRVHTNGQLNSVSSGGSVWLHANRLSGNGRIEATGADHDGSYFVGGGGRIALFVEDLNFGDWQSTDRITARTGETGNNGYLAGAGTVFIRNSSYPEGWLRIDNGNSENFDLLNDTAPHDRLTALPSLGTVSAVVTAAGHLQANDLPELNDLAGMYVVIEETQTEAKIVSHTSDILYLDTPLTNPGETVSVSGLHKFDLVEVLDGGILQTEDQLQMGALRLNNGYLIAPQSTVEQPLVFESGGSGRLDHDPGFSELNIDTDFKLILDTSLTLETLSLQNGAQISLTDYHPIMATDITIDGTSQISSHIISTVSSNSPLSYSHGGLGAYSYTKQNPSGHGSLYYPTSIGFSNGTRAAGGVVHLEFDTLALDGTISVKPANYNHTAGGSIYLRGNSINGTGRLDATGADEYWAGGGGRIALHVEDLTGFGDWRSERRIDARGGDDTNQAGAGTVLLRNSQYPNGLLHLDNANQTTRMDFSTVLPSFGTRSVQRLGDRQLFVAGLPEYNDFSGMYLKLPGDVELEIVAHTQETITVAQDLPAFTGEIDVQAVHVLDRVDIFNGATLQTADELRILGQLHLDDGSLDAAELNVLGTFEFPSGGEGNLSVDPGLSELQIDTDYNLTLNTPLQLEALRLSNGAMLNMTGHPLSATLIQVDASSTIRSHLPQEINIEQSEQTNHGGIGASNNRPDARTHGSLYYPRQRGFANSPSQTVGGIVELSFDELQLDGLIDVNGNGRYAGGSILLTGNTLSGSGRMEARGGDETYAGAGGRIALHVENLTGFGDWQTEGRINARGGKRPNLESSAIFNGGTGTLFIRNQTYPNGWLWLDNNPGEETPIINEERSTPLPTFGQVAMTFVDENTLATVDGQNFHVNDDFTGYTVTIPGQGERQVASNDQQTLTLTTPISSFADSLVVHATHIFDRVDIRNGAQLASSDPLQVLGDFNINQGGFAADDFDLAGQFTFPAGGEGTLAADPGLAVIEIDTDYTLTLKADLQTQRLALSNGAQLLVDGGRIQADTIDIGVGSSLVSQIAQSINVTREYEYSHGGIGASNNRTDAKPHGSLYVPHYQGFRSSSSNQIGGVVDLEFTELILNGSINVTSPSNGAGGSILMRGDRISGSGQMQARGGDDTYSGGGGRIALYIEDFSGFGDWLQEGRISAQGGLRPGFDQSPLFNGGTGTVYINNTSYPNGWLLVDNNPGAQTPVLTEPGSTPLPSIGNTAVTFVDETTLALADDVTFGDFDDFTGHTIVIPGQGERTVLSNDQVSLNLAEPIVSFTDSLVITGQYTFDRLDVRNGADLTTADRIRVLGEFQLSNGGLNAADLDLAGNWIQESGDYGVLRVDPNLSAITIETDFELVILTALQTTNITLRNGGVLQTQGDPIEATHVIVDANSAIRSQMPQGENVTRQEEYSYGGIGAANGYSTPLARGSLYFPRQSGARSGVSNEVGGIIDLRFETLQLDGMIDVNSEYNRGSGGSILLTGTTLSGSGQLQARGHDETYGGGGGRIAVHVNDLTGFGDWFNEGRISAQGGIRENVNSPIFNGGAGTVFIRDSNYVDGWLLVDNHPGNTMERILTGPGSTPLPGLGSKQVTFGDATTLMLAEGETAIEPRTDLEGLYAVIPGVGEILITANSETSITLAQPIATFEGSLAITAVHRLDRLDVRGGASLDARDPLSAAALFIDDPSALEATLDDSVAPAIDAVVITPLIDDALDSDQSFDITFTVTENLQLRTLSLQFNGETASLNRDGVTYSTTLTAPIVETQQSFDLVIEASDYGNNSDTFTQSVLVVPPDTEAPTPQLISPAEGTHVDMNTNFTTVLNASDNRAVRTIEATFNGQTQSQTLENDALGEDISFDWQAPTVFTDTEFILEVVAIDLAGNRTTPAQPFSIFVDQVVGDVQPVLLSPAGRILQSGNTLFAEIGMVGETQAESITVTFDSFSQTLESAPFQFSIPTPIVEGTTQIDMTISATIGEETGSALETFTVVTNQFAKPEFERFYPESNAVVHSGAPLLIGVDQTLFTDDFEYSGKHQWITNQLGSGSEYNWTRRYTDVVPNDYGYAYYIRDEAQQHVALQAPGIVPSAGSLLTFDYRVRQLNGAEGIQLHIQVEGEQESTDLGPYMTEGGYNAEITFAEHPMQGQMAWTGSLQGSVSVDLSNWAGQTVALQWIKAGDNSTTNGNEFAFDNVAVSCGDACDNLQVRLNGEASQWTRVDDSFIAVTLPYVNESSEINYTLEWPASAALGEAAQWVLLAEGSPVTLLPDTTPPLITLAEPIPNAAINAGDTLAIQPIIVDQAPVILPLMESQRGWYPDNQNGYWLIGETESIDLEFTYGEITELRSRSYPVPAQAAEFTFSSSADGSVYYPSKAPDGSLAVMRLLLSIDDGETWVDAQPHITEGSYNEPVELYGETLSGWVDSHTREVRVDLSAYAGESITFRFLAHRNDMTQLYWSLSNLVMTGMQPTGTERLTTALAAIETASIPLDAPDFSGALETDSQASTGMVSLNIQASDIENNATFFSRSLLMVGSDAVRRSNLTLAAGDTSLDGSKLVLDAGTHQIDGAHSFNDLFLLPGATLTQTPRVDNSAGVPAIMNIGGELLVSAGASIDYSGSGYPAGVAHAGTSSDNKGHGGLGSNQTEGSYGSPFDPTTPGSNHGGGVMLITAGTMTLNGELRADGMLGDQGFGSGGSISLDANFIEGEGLLSANGFSDADANEPGGGGGRIAILAYEHNFTGTVETRGGLGAGAGTFYDRGSNTLTVAGGQGNQTLLPSLTSNEVNLTVSEAHAVVQGHPGYEGQLSVIDGHLTIEETDQVDLRYRLHADNARLEGNLLLDSDTIAMGQPNSFLELVGQIAADNFILLGGEGPPFGDKRRMPVEPVPRTELFLAGTLTAPGLTLLGQSRISSLEDLPGTPVHLDIADELYIGYDASICGCNGEGQDGNRIAHAGQALDEAGLPTGEPYGNFYRPLTSGGDGGVIHIQAGTLSLEGAILAQTQGCGEESGEGPIFEKRAPGDTPGSGGSILIEANTFYGYGRISAVGTSPRPSETPEMTPSGGRIALYTQSEIDRYEGPRFWVYGGWHNGREAAPGTVYIQSPTYPKGLLGIGGIDGYYPELSENNPRVLLSGLGERTVAANTSVNGNTFSEPNANFPANLEGRYWVDENENSVLITANQSDTLIGETAFPALAQDQLYWGVHDLDELIVQWPVTSEDEIRFNGVNFVIYDEIDILNVNVNDYLSKRAERQTVHSDATPTRTQEVRFEAGMHQHTGALKTERLVLRPGSTLTVDGPVIVDQLILEEAQLIVTTPTMGQPTVEANTIILRRATLTADGVKVHNMLDVGPHAAVEPFSHGNVVKPDQAPQGLAARDMLHAGTWLTLDLAELRLAGRLGRKADTNQGVWFSGASSLERMAFDDAHIPAVVVLPGGRLQQAELTAESLRFKADVTVADAKLAVITLHAPELELANRAHLRALDHTLTLHVDGGFSVAPNAVIEANALETNQQKPQNAATYDSPLLIQVPTIESTQGGFIDIHSRSLRHDGRISARGINNGAGGYLRLKVVMLSGNGNFDVRGGEDEAANGGRIAIDTQQRYSFSGDALTGLGTLVLRDRIANSLSLYQAMRNGKPMVEDATAMVAPLLTLNQRQINKADIQNKQTKLYLTVANNWLGTQQLFLKGTDSVFPIQWIDAQRQDSILLLLQGSLEASNGDTLTLALPIDNIDDWPGERHGLQLIDRSEVNP